MTAEEIGCVIDTVLRIMMKFGMEKLSDQIIIFRETDYLSSEVVSLSEDRN